MPEIKLIIPGSIRSKKNSKRVYARGRFKTVLPSRAYEKWEKEARDFVYYRMLQPLARPCGHNPFPLGCPVSVEAHFHYKGPRPDLSGCEESLGDGMEGIIWANDGQIESWDGSRLHHDLKNPRTEIIVRW